MIKEILRLRGMGLSGRKIALALDCSRNTVEKYLKQAGNISAVPEANYHAPWSSDLDWQAIHGKTVRGIPLSEVWETYGFLVPYVSFWREYRRRFPNVPLDFHKDHPPGERCEIDYKGDSHGLGYYDRRNGEFVPCRLFGAVLCFSQLFFPRATLSERRADLLESIADAYSYFGGVPLTSAVDNAKASVTRADRYDPDLNPEFALFCEHFGTAPLAMRPGKPKDKNLIENALGVFWRWARRRINERRCFSLGELNEYLSSLADEFNERIQRKYGVSRRTKFNGSEKEVLLPIPSTAYSYGEWKKAIPHPDCHIQVGKNFYSIPYQFRGRDVEVRIGSSLVEVFVDLKCVARHLRAHPNQQGNYITRNEHLPETHQAMREQTPQYCIDEARKIGPATELIIDSLITSARHPLMLLRRAQGILRLAKRYSNAELESSCLVVLNIGSSSPRLKDIEGIIKNNVEEHQGSITPINRKTNPFLRGQKTWKTSQLLAGEINECSRSNN